MSTEPNSWWVSIDGKPTGPVSEGEVKQRLANGELRPDTYVCRAGSEEWVRLAECAEFSTASEDSQGTPPPLPPDHAARTKPSWNPLAVAWLGLLFTPAWTGIMAALNARRLGLNLPLWRPLAIGVGTTVVAILAAFAGIEFGAFFDELIFTVAPLVAIYYLDLAPQQKPHAARQPKTQDHWIRPVLAGSPLALLTIVSWWLTLFGPLEPLEVVQRFTDAETPEEAREYVTSNLYQMVDDFKEAERLAPEQFSDDEGEAEYLAEYYDENDSNQYYIDYRWYFPPHGGEPGLTLEGYFHLRWLDGAWKIDDLLVTSLNGQEPDAGAISFSVIVSELLSEVRRTASSEPRSKTGWSLSKFWDGLPTTTKRWIGMLAVIIAFGAARALSNLKTS